MKKKYEGTELGLYIQRKTEELKKDPNKAETARAYLIKVGILDKTGTRLSRRYR